MKNVETEEVYLKEGTWTTKESGGGGGTEEYAENLLCNEYYMQVVHKNWYRNMPSDVKTLFAL